MEDYVFYMQQFPSIVVGDGGIETKVEKPIFDLERDFIGLKYKSLTGAEDYGKPNIYTESFAESEEISVYIPSVVVLSSTELVFTFYFFGEDLRNTYHTFVDYVRGKKLFYWDTCRERKIAMFQSDEIKPPTDLLYGSSPYLSVDIKFTNIFGRTFDLDHDFSTLTE